MSECESDEYGRDCDDCQQIVNKWEGVMRELAAAGERVAGEWSRDKEPYAQDVVEKGLPEIQAST